MPFAPPLGINSCHEEQRSGLPQVQSAPLPDPGMRHLQLKCGLKRSPRTAAALALLLTAALVSGHAQQKDLPSDDLPSAFNAPAHFITRRKSKASAARIPAARTARPR